MIATRRAAAPPSFELARDGGSPSGSRKKVAFLRPQIIGESGSFKNYCGTALETPIRPLHVLWRWTAVAVPLSLPSATCLDFCAAEWKDSQRVPPHPENPE